MSENFLLSILTHGFMYSFTSVSKSANNSLSHGELNNPLKKSIISNSLHSSTILAKYSEYSLNFSAASFQKFSSTSL